VDADRGLPVGQQPPDHRDDPPPLRQEGLLVGVHRAAGHRVASVTVRSSVKQVWVPVWQAAPICSTVTSRASPSQSSATLFTYWWWPEVAPFTQYSPRLRDQYVARPLVSVRCSASSSIQASMSTSPVPCSRTIAATRPSA